ncbi:MAG: hypothetical protein H0U65_07825 [Rubrobacter sp.]|jgi:hypothetical protein|nr:hypothetical protein [Rubrobacter sp.]
MWKKRFLETFAIVIIGDGVIEVLAPREHSLLWHVGPGKGVARFFAENPKYMRLLGLSQIGFGVWLAMRQYRGE